MIQMRPAVNARQPQGSPSLGPEARSRSNGGRTAAGSGRTRPYRADGFSASSQWKLPRQPQQLMPYANTFTGVCGFIDASTIGARQMTAPSAADWNPMVSGGINTASHGKVHNASILAKNAESATCEAMESRRKTCHKTYQWVSKRQECFRPAGKEQRSCMLRHPYSGSSRRSS